MLMMHLLLIYYFDSFHEYSMGVCGPNPIVISSFLFFYIVAFIILFLHVWYKGLRIYIASLGLFEQISPRLLVSASVAARVSIIKSKDIGTLTDRTRSIKSERSSVGSSHVSIKSSDMNMAEFEKEDPELPELSESSQSEEDEQLFFDFDADEDYSEEHFLHGIQIHILLL